MREDTEFELFREDLTALVVLDTQSGVPTATYVPPEFPEVITLYPGQRLEFIDTDSGRTVLLPYAHEQQRIHIIWHGKEEPQEVPLNDLHPSILGILRFFENDHMPEGKPKEVSKLFQGMALVMAQDDALKGAELTVGLRKLLEAKDCMVRAAL